MHSPLNITAHNGRTVLLNNEEFLVFAGTSYLGIAQNADFRSYLLEGFERYGTNYGSSRRGNIILPIFEQTESYLARLIGSESAVTLSSGMLAGQLLLKQFEEHAHLFIAPGIHPALKPQNYHSRSHSYEQWTTHVLEELHRHKFPEAVIFLDTINILHAKRYDLSWLSQLPTDLKLIVVIDDSHGFGLLGEKGEGHWPKLPQKANIELIMVTSMGKALGVPAGLIAGTTDRINKIRAEGIFGASSPPIPAYLHAFIKSEKIYTSQRKTLTHLTELFRILTEPIRDKFISEDLPVFYIENTSVAPQLLTDKIIISSFPYPTLQSKLITRVVLNSCHTEEDVKFLASHLNILLKPL
ncbi:aminotransferase class I/II-fold pyridoxal phosphate-dependent enzyme [Solitalea lacus]|uniref:aminotransferase class I/II-fold pyridoxal phosphate-dependent enzyme n=1 Tax=Solitalea lacus TaxID=2911172 RepID=UPI001EDA1A72|nr:aminotransferase class I/II-fold pyridoxal phosphate-dependent enzyme [Solitalea lacus]UKJ08031.1 aminotransferase class I/II-fold pyridoxal phosphate-dependent enzyme [Solitalea lacus]